MEFRQNEPEHRESRQTRYFRNYQYEKVPDDSRRGYKNVYRYIGDYYYWDISGQKLRSFRIRFALLEVVSIGCFLLAALSNGQLNSQAGTAVPALLTLVALIFEVIAVGILCFAKYPLREDDYNRIHNTFSITFWIRAALLVIAAIFSLINTMQMHPGYSCILTILGYLSSAAIAIWMYYLFRHLSTFKRCKVHDSSRPET